MKTIFSKTILVIATLLTLCLLAGCTQTSGDGQATSADNTCTVSFDTGGGTEIAAQKLEKGSRVQKPQDPERAGYTFNGWTYQNETWSFVGYIVFENMTLTAEWIPNTYSITYYTLGGGTNDQANPTTFVADGNNITLATPTRSGYTFTGWTWEGQTEPQLTVTVPTDVYKNQYFVAHWQGHILTITFDANGGNAVEPMTVTYNENCTLPTPTRENHSFVGWYYNAAKVQNSGVWLYDSNVTLTAHWEGPSKVTFDADGGEAVEPMTIEYGQSYTLPTPTRTGAYSFAGWYKGSTLVQNSGTWQYKTDIALTAHWEEVSAYISPISTTSAATFDNSTAADVPDLIATEIMPNPDDNADYFEFIEFYNRGATDVNFYDLALVRAPDFQIDPSLGQDNPYYSSKYMWGQQRKFQSKVDINGGELAIPADVTLYPGVTFTNPASGIVAPHSFAIIWVVNKNTVAAVNEASVDYDPVPADLPIRLFRERFGLPNDFDVPIFYIWGDSALEKNGSTTTIKTNEFELTDCSNTKYENFMLGLVDKSFALSESVYSSNTFNAKVKTLFGYGVKQAMSYNGKQNTCTAFTYVPADQLPVVANRKKDKSDEIATDYVTGSYVESYRQAGMADGLTTPTPGTMPAYQWYYVDAANAPASVKGTDPDWGPKAVQAWVTAVAGPEGGIDADYNDPNQVVIEVSPPTQEELNERFFGGRKNNIIGETPISSITQGFVLISSEDEAHA